MSAVVEKGSVASVRWFSLSRFDVLRIVLGIVLLFAASLKAYQLATAPAAETSLLNSKWFLVLVVEWESFLGLWLLAGFVPRVLRWATLVWFVMLLGVALSQAASGVRSCACFGFVEVAPWVMVGFDLAAVAGLWLVRPPCAPPINDYFYTSCFPP